MNLLLICSIAMAGGTATEDTKAWVSSLAQYGDDTRASRNTPWWTGFEDPSLTIVIQTGLQQNPGLEAANLRIALASAARWQSLSGLLPQVSFEAATQQSPTDATSLSPYTANAPDYSEAFQSIGTLLADVARATGTDPSGLPDFSGGQQTAIPDTYRQSSTMLKSMWAIDIFGRQTLRTLASSKNLQATRLGRDATMRGLTGQIGAAWYDLVAAREQHQVVKRQVQTAQNMLEVVQLRYEQGGGSALDVLQQRQQLAATAALAPLAKASLKLAHGRLAVALGQPPSADLPPSKGWPILGPAPTAGDPAQLVDDRADIQAAVRKLERTSLERAASFSALAPTLILTGQIGRQYLTFDETDSVDTWGLGAVMTVPIFAGGRTHAGIKAARVARDIANIELRAIALDAVNQVESAFAIELAAAATLNARRTQATAAQHALNESRTHYVQGLAPYVSLLAALGANQGAELALLDAERARVQARIQLHTALGGRWRPQSENSP
jgi:outer membrane protein TolC